MLRQEHPSYALIDDEDYITLQSSAIKALKTSTDQPPRSFTHVEVWKDRVPENLQIASIKRTNATPPEPFHYFKPRFLSPNHRIMIISVVGGSGSVGTALAARLAAAGHSIVIASRDPSGERVQAAKKKIASAAKMPDTVTSLPVREACDKSDAVLITVPGIPTAEGMADLAASMGPCTGKPLIDCTNPLSAYPGLELTTDRNTTSATEEFAKVFPACGGVYKAFNTVGVAILGNPVMENNEKGSMLYAGPSKADASSSFQTVTDIIADTDFVPCYVGAQRQARNLEALGEMWIHMALKYPDLPYQSTHAPVNFAWKVLYR